MAKRLTDKQRKQIIADYVQMQSYRAVARAHNTTATTVRTIVKADADTLQKCAQKNKENTDEVLRHLESRKLKACEIIDKMLNELGDVDKIKNATLPQIATSMGVVIDKFTAGETHDKNEDNEVKIIDDV